MDFDIIGTIEPIIDNRKFWKMVYDMSIYIYYIKKHKKCIQFIVSACRNVFLRNGIIGKSRCLFKDETAAKS